MLARKNVRGLTLLEVMTAAAMMAIAMTVATAIFVTLVTQRREGERFLEVQAASMSAVSQTQLDISNAGFRFPAPAFGVHVYNNVSSLSSGGGAPTYINNTGCGTGGLAQGSDAIEVATGSPQFLAGKVQFVAPGPNPADEYNVVLTAATPFTNADNIAPGLALFYGGDGESCIGEVLLGPGGMPAPPQMNVRMLDWNYETVASAAAYYPNCPRKDMSVYRFASRKRFFLCEEATLPDGGGLLYAMYTQSSPSDGGYIYDNTAMTRLQQGLEDMQIVARVNGGSPSPLVATDVDCHASAVVGARPHCECNKTSTSACSMTGAPMSLTAASPEANLTGVSMELTTLGMRPMKEGGSDGGMRPASKDHVAGVAHDGNRRLQHDMSFAMNNITQVRP